MSAFWNRENVTFTIFGYTGNLGDLTALPVVVGYALCSSLLAIINKYALNVFPFASLLTALQYITCVVAVLALGRIKVLNHDALTWDMLRKFLPAACVFYLAIFTNTKLLQVANVETFIVFRSSTPILVAFADFLFRKQPWPGSYTLGALSVILAGAVGYVFADKDFTLHAYSWACAYLLTITFEMVYIKHVVSSFGLNTWGLVLYNNLLSLALAPLFWFFTGEFKDTMVVPALGDWQMGVVVPVALSCGFGLGISFFGFACRKAVSATTFTVVGVTNKLLTVIINVLIWDKHATPTGISCLLVTILGGVLYQQSTVPAAKKPAGVSPPPQDVEASKPLVAEEGSELEERKHTG